MGEINRGGIVHAQQPPPTGGGAAALRRCSVVVQSAAPLFVPPLTIVRLHFAAVLFDPEGWANTATNTITVPDEGDYQLHAFISWTSVGATDPHSGTFRRLTMTYSSPAQELIRLDDPAQLINTDQCQERTGYRHLLAGQGVFAIVTHNASGTMIVSGGSANPNELTLLKVG